jgi:hypothetical protein
VRHIGDLSPTYLCEASNSYEIDWQKNLASSSATEARKSMADLLDMRLIDEIVASQLICRGDSHRQCR